MFWILLVEHIQEFQCCHLMMVVFLLELPMEPSLGSLGRPTVMGPIDTLVVW